MASNVTPQEYQYQQLEIEYNNYQHSIDTILIPILVASGFIGVIGSILTEVALFRNPDFSEPCFICYQAIAIYESILCASFSYFFLFIIFAQTWKKSSFLYWLKLIFAYETLDPCREGVTFITIYLAAARVVACFFPMKFRYIDKRWVSYLVSVILTVPVFVIGIPLEVIIEMKWIEETGLFQATTIDMDLDGKIGKAKYMLYIILSVAVLGSMVFAVAALIKAILVRKRLFKENPNAAFHQPNSNQKEALSLVKRNLQLCYLQLSLSIPLIFNNLTYFIIQFYPDDLIENAKQKGDFSLQYQIYWLWNINYITEAVGHCSHFYIYMMFSKSFREGFLKRVRKK